ncbi:MAG TPA: uracil-DNA glycosylase [Verrucomicrobiae bacterium]|nr:uracil-DNA glycosylase [Verrucomicrobiae bacterium]
MPDAYEALLDATIQHLEDLKEQGTRFVPITTEALANLRRFSPFAVRLAVVDVNRSAARDPEPPPAATPQHRPAAVANASPSKKEALEEIRRRALECVKCAHLASSRKNVVFGIGNVDAELMFVGEAPGASEDLRGEPFVGPAGELLTKIIEAMGLSREAVYIANILKCRPDTPGQTSGNRKPTPEEMQTCIPFLHEQVDLIRPKVLVALGATAAEGLLGKTTGIMRLRGQWHTYRDIPLMPTFHPSYLLHNQSPATKRQVWEDMMQVMEKLGMPISEKQKRFFLPKSAAASE